jgi:dihydrofolate synthase/folylpolyglutamate synthase
MRFDNLDAWLDWQAGLNPRRMELGLDRVHQVWSRLGPGLLPFRVITVGGTNGKGSCAAMIEAIAEAAGYRTACYTSPHVQRYNERVRVGAEPVGDEALCEAFERVEQARGDTPLTYFEFGTLAALDLFVRAAPDLAILEVGLGGRLDAVNLIDADVSVVTRIARDHTDWLGEDLEAIAFEKAGIFRVRRPAVIGQPDAPPRLRQEAMNRGSRVLQLGREIQAETAVGGWTWVGPAGERLALPLPALRGPFQTQNAAAAIAALNCLRDRLPVPVNAIRVGLQRARLQGRFQVVPGEVTLVFDVAHNGDAAEALAGNLRVLGCPGRRRAVLAVLKDKEPEAIATPLLSLVRDWYLTSSDDPRAMPTGELAARLDPVLGDAAVTTAPDVPSAIAAACAAAEPGDCILVFGSFTTVGEGLRHAGSGCAAAILCPPDPR